jgi:hypothetical protein
LDDREELGRVTVSAIGTFEFPRVPSGQFQIHIESRPSPAPSGARPWLQAGNGSDSIAGRTDAPLAAVPLEDVLWASVDAAVGDRDLELPGISLSRAYPITGRVVFNGGAPRPTAEELARTPVFLRSHDGSDLGEFPVGRVAADATFRTTGVPVGRYVISPQLRLGPWRLSHVLQDGRLTPDDLVTIGDRGPARVDLIFTDSRTELSGAVRDARGRPTSDAYVVLFPADSNRWKDFGPLPRGFRRVRVSAEATYFFTELPAGTYFVAAVGADLPENWLSAEVMSKLVAGAEKITLADGNVQIRDLTIRPARPTPPALRPMVRRRASRD